MKYKHKIVRTPNEQNIMSVYNKKKINLQSKANILKAVSEKQITYQGRPIRITAESSNFRSEAGLSYYISSFGITTVNKDYHSQQSYQHCPQ